jgi:hypothetical protein
MSFRFANNGKTLAVGDTEDSSNATGIDDNPDKSSVPRSGAVWLY